MSWYLVGGADIMEEPQKNQEPVIGAIAEPKPNMPLRKLTEKQRRWVEFYMGEAEGNATEAARLAKYKGNDVTLAQVGAENLRKPHVQAAIAERVAADPAIATREDRQRFWTLVMNNKAESMKYRLRASEILGKSQCDFVEKHEHKIMSWMDLVTEVDESRASPDPSVHH